MSPGHGPAPRPRRSSPGRDAAPSIIEGDRHWLSPPRLAGSYIDMDKGTMRGRRGILADPPNETLCLRSGGSGVDEAIQHLGITDIAAAVAIQVVHPAIPVLIDEDVRGRAQLVLAVAHVAKRPVVRRCAVPAHDVKRSHLIAGLVDPCEYILEGDEQSLVQRDVLPGPARLLAQELLETEVGRNQDVLVLRRDLDKPRRRAVAGEPAQRLIRITADPIAIQELALGPVVGDDDECLYRDRVAPTRGNDLN